MSSDEFKELSRSFQEDNKENLKMYRKKERNKEAAKKCRKRKLDEIKNFVKKKDESKKNIERE